MNETQTLGPPLPTRPDAPITSPFGTRTHPLTDRETTHFGIDIGAPAGTPVAALADGEVVFVGSQVGRAASGQMTGAGNYVIVRHGDADHGYTYSAAFHLLDDSTVVQVGDPVVRGQALAEVGATGGATGPHLHLEVFEGGDEAVIREGGIGRSGARRLDPAALLDQPFLDRITIQEGDRNAAVEQLQRALVDRGLLPPESVDGDFGPMTRGAVEAAQRQLGVEANGIVDADTRAGLAREQAPVPSPEPRPSEPRPAPGRAVLDTDGPFAGVSVGDLVGVRSGTPLGALTGPQSDALARAVFGDGPGAAALAALDRHYGPGDGTLVRREIALALHEGRLHVGRENADPASGYNIGTFQIGGAGSTPSETRARYDGLVGDGVALYERISGATVDPAGLSPADRDVFAHVGHIVEKGRISASSTPDRHFERLADPELRGDDLARFMSREIQVGVPAIGQAVVAYTDPRRGVGIDLEAVAARAAEPDAARHEPAMPVLHPAFAPDYSPAVEEWQRTLVASGYGVGTAGADGAYGPDTFAATRRAQRDADLIDDGVVGPSTWAAYVPERAHAVEAATPTPGNPQPSTVSIRFLEQLDARAAALLDRYTADPDGAVAALNAATRAGAASRDEIGAALRAFDPSSRPLSAVDADALVRSLGTRSDHATRDPEAAVAVDAQRLTDGPPRSPCGDGATRDVPAPLLTVPSAPTL